MSKFLVTMQYNEEHILPLFLKHYEKYFDKKDIYIIDHGSTMNFDYSEYNHIRIPRDKPFSEKSRIELIKNLTTGLLNYYDYGVYADCDELICLDHTEDMILNTGQPIIYVAAFDVFKKDNKLYGIFDSIGCKPLIFSRPVDWQLGFHGCQYAPDDDLVVPMAHIRYLDEEHRDERNNLRVLIRNDMDIIEKDLNSNHHWVDQTYYNRFKEVINNFDKQSIQKFTYVPSSMIIEPTSNYFTLNTFGVYRTIDGDLHNVIFDLTDYFSELA